MIPNHPSKKTTGMVAKKNLHSYISITPLISTIWCPQKLLVTFLFSQGASTQTRCQKQALRRPKPPVTAQGPSHFAKKVNRTETQAKVFEFEFLNYLSL